MLTVPGRATRQPATGPNSPSPILLSFVLGAAAAVRLVWWLVVDGPLYGGDSRQYVSWAAALAAGDFSVAREWPLHLFYPLALAPMYVLRAPEGPYVLGLHIAAALATVWLLFQAAAKIGGQRYGLGVAALGAVYPSAVFWFPYVLTETVFLFVLSLFVFATLALVRRPTARQGTLFAVASIVLLLARPVAVPLVAAAIAAFAVPLLGRRWGWPRAVAAALLGCAACGALSLVLVLAVPRLGEHILRLPTVTQSLWLSTRVSSSNLDEILALQEAPLPPETPEEAVWEFKRAYALRFIVEQPTLYLAMAARRFVSFWYPWLFASWSLGHRLVDAALSLALTAGLLAALVRRASRTPAVVTLAVLAHTLALLSAFSQIDSDARYRLPAELILLLVAPLGLRELVRGAAQHGRAARSRRG